MYQAASNVPEARLRSCAKRLIWLTWINLIQDHDLILRRGEDATTLAHLQAALASARAAAPSLVPVVVVWRAAGAGAGAASQQAWTVEDAIASAAQLGAVVVRRNSPDEREVSVRGFRHLGPDSPPVAPALLLPHADLPGVLAEALGKLPEGVSSWVDQELVLWTDPYVLFTGDVNVCALERPEAWSCGGCSSGTNVGRGSGAQRGPETASADGGVADVGVALLRLPAFGRLCEQALAKHAGSGNGNGVSAAEAALQELLPRAGELPPPLQYRLSWGMPHAASSKTNGLLGIQLADDAGAGMASASETTVPGIILLRTRHPPLHHALCALQQADPRQQTATASAQRPSSESAVAPAVAATSSFATSLQLALDHCCLEQGYSCGSTARGSSSSADGSSGGSTVTAALLEAWRRDAGRLVRAAAALFEHHSEAAWRAMKRSKPAPLPPSPTGAADAHAALGIYQSQEFTVARAAMSNMRVLLLTHFKSNTGGTLVVLDLAQVLHEAGARVEVATVYRGGQAQHPATRLVPMRVLRPHIKMEWDYAKPQHVPPGSGTAPASGAGGSGAEHEYAWFNPRAYDAIVPNTHFLDHVLFGFWLRHQVEAYGEAFTSRLVWWIHESPDWGHMDNVTRRIAASGRVPFLLAGHKVLSWYLPGIAKHAREAVRPTPSPPPTAHYGVVYPILSDELARNALVAPLERAQLRAHARRAVLVPQPRGGRARRGGGGGGEGWPAAAAAALVPADATLILSVGRFDDNKGFLQTLDAADEACARLLANGGGGVGGVGPPAAAAAEAASCPHMVFVTGYGGLDRNLSATLRALPPGHVHVLNQPSGDAIRSLYHGADMLVMNSRVECFTRVVIEAMSCGLPVIASADAGDTAAVLAHGVTGLLHNDQNDIAAITQHMLDLLPATPGGAARAARIGAAGRARFLEMYHPAGQQLEWFRRIAAAGVRARATGAAAAAAIAGRQEQELPAFLRQAPQPNGPWSRGGALWRYSVPVMPLWTRRDLAWEWRRHPDAPAGAVAAGAVGVMLGGSLYVFGGLHANGTRRTSLTVWRLSLDAAAAALAVEALNSSSSSRSSSSASGGWTQATTLPQGIGVTALSAIPYRDRLMYLAGGVSKDGSGCVDTAAMHDADANAWHGLPPLPAALCGAVSVVDPARHLLHLLKGTPSMLSSGANVSVADDNRYSHLTLQLQPNGMPAPGSTWQVAAPAPPDAMGRHTVALPLLQDRHSSGSAPTSAAPGRHASAAGAAAPAVQFLGGCYAGIPGIADPPPGAFAPPWRLHECTLDARPSYRVGLQGAGSGAGAGEWAAQLSPLPLPLQHMCGVALGGGVALVAGGANAASWANGFLYAYHVGAHAAAAVGYLPQGPLVAPVCAVWQGRLWVLLGEKSASGHTLLGRSSAEVWSAQLPEGLLVAAGDKSHVHG